MRFKVCLVCNRRKVLSCFSPTTETLDNRAFVCDLCIRTGNEVWKPVEGWPNYEVSNLGRVRSLGGYRNCGRAGYQYRPGKVLKPTVSSYIATISVHDPAKPQDTLGVARLVLRTFFREPLPGEEARHYLNPDPLDCRLENLRWGTHRQNVGDEVKHYGAHHCKGVKRSAETRAKISAANKGRKASPESRAKISSSLRGKNLSAEHRAKLSAAHLKRRKQIKGE